MACDLLVVDDNPGDVQLIRLAFGAVDRSIVLESLADGREALEALHNGLRPRLIVLDLNLPGLRGHEMLQRLRATDGLASLAVVVLSSSDAPDDLARSAALGARHFSKPDSFRDLRALAQRLWRQYLISREEGSS